MKRLLASLPAAAVAALAAAALLAAPAAARPSIALPAQQVEALLQLRHPGGLDRFARAVSDPTSPRYRRYATVERLVARYGAKPKTRKRVLGWLRAHGLRGTVTASGTDVLVPIAANRAARLLPRAASARPGSAAARVGRRVPAALRGSVVAISLLGRRRAAPASSAGKASAAAAAASASGASRPYLSIRLHSGTASGCAAGSSGGAGPGYEPFTPNQYLTAYGLAAMHAKGLEGQGRTIAIVEGGGFKRSDIATFTRCFGGKPPPIRVVRVGLGKYVPPAEDEPTLDVSMVAVAAPKAKVYAYEGGGLEGSLIETAGAALGSRGHRPDVISMSYGFCEPQVSGQLAFRAAIDNIFAVAAGAGISVLASAGDQGSSGCRTFTPEGEETAAPVLAVSLPASSAYATAVGGTNLWLSRRNRIKGQIAWNDSPLQASGGGGGTSLLYPRTPWWQAKLGRYGLGRKLPDIAALADVAPGYALYCTAPECEPRAAAVYGWTSFGGTSAATPLMAAGVALVNQYAARRHLPPVGFLNPLLYRLGAKVRTRRGAFDDVVKGNNDIGSALAAAAGGGRPLGCCAARRGFDRASGWGSLKVPGFAKLAAAAAKR